MRTSTFKKSRRRKSRISKNSSWLWVALATIALFAWIAWNAWQGSRGTDIVRLNRVGTQVGEIAPDFTVTTLDGGEYSLGTQRGTPPLFSSWRIGAALVYPKRRRLLG